MRAGCGCLATTLDRRSLEPGQKATLLVRLRTTGQPNGPRSWNLHLRYRDGDREHEQAIVLAAAVRNEVTVEPSILALYVDKAQRQEIVVSDARKPGLKVTGANATSSAIGTSLRPLGGGRTAVVLDVSSADLGPGRQDVMLNIYTDDPLHNPLQVPITLARGERPAVLASPPRVAARGAVASTTLVRLRPGVGARLAVEKVECDGAGVSCTWAAGPDDGATLRVQVDGRRLARHDQVRQVRVRLAEPAGAVVTIPVLIDE